MAVRTPLINDSGNVKEMSSTQVDEIVDQVVYQYSLNPGVTLSVVGSGGNLSSISDTRWQAGAASTSATDAIKIAAGHSWFGNLPNTTVADIHAISSTGTVTCIVAALLDDVA